MPLLNVPIRIFDSDFNFIAETSLYQEAYYQRLEYGIGEFEIKLNLNINTAIEFVVGRYVQFDLDKKKIGVIIEVKKEIGERGKGDQILIVKGREAKYIFTHRLIIPPAGAATYESTYNCERSLKRLIDFQAGSGCPDANRQLPNFTIDTDQNRGVSYYINERGSVLSDIIEALCLACEMGYYIYLDDVSKQLRLEVNFGIDRTAEQTINGQVIFSTERNTLRKGAITQSNVNYKNICYAAGSGEGAYRNIRVLFIDVAEPTGWNRKETWLDIKQADDNTKVDALAAKRLSELQYQQYAEGQFLNYSSYVFGKDFDIGDYITLKVYDTQTNVKITGARESWGYGKYEIEFNYDRQYPQFNSTVTGRVNKIQGILNNTEPVNIPIGSIIAWHKSLPGVPQVLLDNWLECNGQVVTNQNSPVYGQTLPNLNGQGRFLRGGSTSGILQNHAFENHQHTQNASTSTTGGAQAGSLYDFTAGSGLQSTNVLTTVASTGNAATETRPINMTVVWIIRIK